LYLNYKPFRKLDLLPSSGPVTLSLTQSLLFSNNLKEWNGNGQFAPVLSQATRDEDRWGNEGISSPIFNFASKWKIVVSYTALKAVP
jgi:hypothetical protein